MKVTQLKARIDFRLELRWWSIIRIYSRSWKKERIRQCPRLYTILGAQVSFNTLSASDTTILFRNFYIHFDLAEDTIQHSHFIIELSLFEFSEKNISSCSKRPQEYHAEHLQNLDTQNSHIGMLKQCVFYAKIDHHHLLQVPASGTASEIPVQLPIPGCAVDTSPNRLLLAARQVEKSFAAMSILASSERRVGQQSLKTAHVARLSHKTFADHLRHGPFRYSLHLYHTSQITMSGTRLRYAYGKSAEDFAVLWLSGHRSTARTILSECIGDFRSHVNAIPCLITFILINRIWAGSYMLMA